jgi:hypothetical protein
MLEMRNYFLVVGLVVIGLLLANGVIAQFEDQNQVNEAIQNGINYLENQESLSDELLVLRFIQEKHSEYDFQSTINEKAPKMMAFHYPIESFVLGERLDESSILSGTRDAPYYSSFIDYFSCKPLTSDWLNSLSNLNNDDSEFGVYNESHSLLLLQLLKDDYDNGRCGLDPLVSQLDSLIEKKASLVQSSLNEKDNFDVWVERVAVLGFAGYPVSEENVQYILDQQMIDGGWKVADYYADEDTESHPTALSVWALVEASK